MLPLCVDLDGTLCKSDLLWESFLSVLKHRPWRLLLIPFWLLHGRAHLKLQLFRHANINVALLPYRIDFLDYLKAQKLSGRPLFLVTASDREAARQIADHLGIFDDVLGSAEKNNLKARIKSRALLEKFGEKKFDYAGDSYADIPVWQVANQAILVNVSPALARHATKNLPISEDFYSRSQPVFRTLLKALRIHQWAKNALVFVPLLAAHLYSDIASVKAALLAFTAFSLAASAVYVFNDLLDLEADRAHPRKSLRPFASGNLPLSWGLALFPLLAGISLGISYGVNTKFLLALIAYLALTLAYSYFLKRLMMVDVIVLAALYTIRIIAGALAIQVELSHWLLVLSVFLFTSLALLKRHAELSDMRDNGRRETTGRGYLASDLEQISSMGASSGYLSVLTLALYVQTETASALYSHPEFLWALTLILLYWISRIWLLAHRRLIHEDPIVFALKDRVSHLLILISVGVILAAI